MIPVALAVVAFALASSSIEALVPFSLALRIVGVAIIGIPVIWRRVRTTHDRRRARASVTFLVLLSAGYLIYLGSATLPHGFEGTFLTRALAVGLLIALASILIRFYSAVQLSRGLLLGLSVVVVASLGSSLIGLEFAIENDRLRGVLENANALGFAGATLVVIGVVLAQRTLTTVTVVAIGAAAILLSASRASLLLVAVAVIGYALVKVGRARFLLVLGAIAVACTAVAGVIDVQDVLLFRDVNTRESSLEAALHVLNTRPWTGDGFQSTETAVAGSLFTAAVDAGWPGVLGILLSYVGLTVAGAVAGRATFIFTIAVVVHSLFESWMIALSGPMALIVIVTWIAMSARDEESRLLTSPSTGEPIAAGQPGVERRSAASTGRPNPVHPTPRFP